MHEKSIVKYVHIKSTRFIKGEREGNALTRRGGYAQRESEETEREARTPARGSDLFRARGGYAASPLRSENERLLHTRRKAAAEGRREADSLNATLRSVWTAEMQTLRHATE